MAKAKQKVHKFTQEHAVRMYRTLRLVHRGLEGGSIRSKPVINLDGKEGIRSMSDIVNEALKPKLSAEKSAS